MPGYTQYFTTSAGSHLNNRCIFTGAQNATWPVPEGTTEVHVHVWGGGGGACHTPTAYGRGGGGGGYARASLSVTSSDSLSITVGGATGTSSVTVPTQTPGSPISATGGTDATSLIAGSGGTGTVALAPTQCQWYCYTATGGAGGHSEVCQAPAGGGAAGSPRGNGGRGGGECCSAGGGIGGSPGDTFKCFQVACRPQPTNFQNKITTQIWMGGSALQARQVSACSHCHLASFMCRPFQTSTTPTVTVEFGSVGCSRFFNTAFNKGGTAPQQAVFAKHDGGRGINKGMDDEWFYVEDMAGSSVAIWASNVLETHSPMPGNGGAGAGGNQCNPAGVLGGGGTAWGGA